ncbi:hypothetical protein [Clostridium sp.]|uniref:hypothetical protein n=1 Tax=Clostridium sp. TaxID=1506 RepID=UPI002FC7315F
MSLNSYKAEVRNFLEKINPIDQGVNPKIKWLEEEFQLLKESVDANETNKIRHQIYDMLYLLFEISADYDFDLDSEWNLGKEKKLKKYMSISNEEV